MERQQQDALGRSKAKLRRRCHCSSTSVAGRYARRRPTELWVPLRFPHEAGLPVASIRQEHRLVHLITAFGGQRFDTRVFMGLFARLAVDTVAEQQRRGHGTSVVSARVEIMRNLVAFFETDVPAMFSQVVTVIGSLLMLFTFHLQAGLIAMAVLLPMGLVNAWYWRRALQLHRGLNDQIEREIEHIQAARLLPLRRHFGRVRRWHVQFSDSELCS
jgi:ABC-type multidrug transport system fused ATPase/permease subunit